MTRTTKVLYNKFNRNDGNIKTVTVGGKTTTYTYDKLNQLTREDNQAGNFTYVWEYDDGGNILSRKKYAYTTGNLGAPTETVNYGYGNSNWGDLLTSYKGSNISYDTIGNVLNDGTRTYTWEHGRELVALTKDSKTWSYTYDANGMRTKRAYGSTVYRYVYNGSQLSQMTIGSNTLFFTYDAGGMPMTVTYNGTVYYYVTNLQGDVVALLDGSGDVVVRYTYDAWGNILSIGGDLADTLGEDNPFRYRGYVYDDETGLYYLQSRYYNPQIGRFINADRYISTGQGLVGFNMFAYCLNNPVNFVDRTGEEAALLEYWSASMWWLCLVDTILPIGEIIFFGGIAVLGVITLSNGQDDILERIEDTDVILASPSLPPDNNDDDDDNDNYYNDDSNFGGRQRISKSKGKMPGDNQRQNRQFKDATKGVKGKDIKRMIHDEISGEGLGYHDIKDVAKDLRFPRIDLYE